MNKKIIFLFLVFMSMPVWVNASSINYHLNITEDMQLSETIKYSVENRVLNTTNYNFLKSVVEDPVYFDLNNSVKYSKTRQKTNTGYLVTLSHKHSAIFLNNERIMKECFSDFVFKSDFSKLSFTSKGPFYCSHRADKITISITTPLTVISNNASSVNGNNYAWNNITDSFVLKMSVKRPELEEDPMDDINKEEESNTTEDNSNNTESESSNTSNYILIGVGVIFLVLLPIIAIVLKKKKDSLDKI